MHASEFRAHGTTSPQARTKPSVARRKTTMKLRALAVVTAGVILSLGSATAQQVGEVHRIGYLQIAPREAQVHLIDAFERGLTEHGYVVGRDVLIEYRFAEGAPE